MSKCDNCEIRKYIARGLDLHWMGEDDCPFECQIEAEENSNG